MSDISFSLARFLGEGRNLSIVKRGLISAFSSISIRIPLILWEVSRIQGKQVNDVNRALLQDTDFLT